VYVPLPHRVFPGCTHTLPAFLRSFLFVTPQHKPIRTASPGYSWSCHALVSGHAKTGHGIPKLVGCHLASHLRTGYRGVAGTPPLSFPLPSQHKRP